MEHERARGRPTDWPAVPRYIRYSNRAFGDMKQQGTHSFAQERKERQWKHRVQKQRAAGAVPDKKSSSNI